MNNDILADQDNTIQVIDRINILLSMAVNKWAIPLIKYCVELGGTQTEIAKRVGVDQAVISRKLKKGGEHNEK